MAQYQHLPIYKTTYDLLLRVTQATVNFPKAYKYSMGDKLRSEITEMVVYIFKANSSRADRAFKLQGQLATYLHSSGYGTAIPSKLKQARFAHETP